MGKLEPSFMLRIFLIVLFSFAAGAAGAASTIMVFGDSISAGYGLPRGASWVNLLESRLARESYDYKVVNASISGETTLGGRNRIAAALAQHKPAILILELGANDGLRGAKIDTIHSNLSAIIAESRKRGSKVLLVGMQLPPNYGSDYTQKFQQVYAALAKSQKVPLVPFMYEGFGADRSAFQADGIHPNAAAQSRMLDTVWPYLQPLLVRSKR